MSEEKSERYRLGADPGVAPEVVEDAHGTRYEPWSDGWAIGFRVTRRRDDAVSYVYLNPSSEDDEGRSNVFLYVSQGEANFTNSVIYVEPFDRKRRGPARMQTARKARST